MLRKQVGLLLVVVGVGMWMGGMCMCGGVDG